jgi:hypothetical protein
VRRDPDTNSATSVLTLGARPVAFGSMADAPAHPRFSFDRSG